MSKTDWVDEHFPNLVALTEGRVSGRISEWPRLKSEAKAVVALLRTLNLTTLSEMYEIDRKIKPSEEGR